VNFTSPLREITYHMGSHSVTCHPAEVTFPPGSLWYDASEHNIEALRTETDFSDFKTFTQSWIVPDFDSGFGRNQAIFPNFAKIRLRYMWPDLARFEKCTMSLDKAPRVILIFWRSVQNWLRTTERKGCFDWVVDELFHVCDWWEHCASCNIMLLRVLVNV